MLTGYAPSAKAVDAIGAIGRDLKLKGSTKAGSFFWGKFRLSKRSMGSLAEYP
jgi:energy-converting hydrogenase Eha subunit B